MTVKYEVFIGLFNQRSKSTASTFLIGVCGLWQLRKKSGSSHCWFPLNTSSFVISNVEASGCAIGAPVTVIIVGKSVLVASVGFKMFVVFKSFSI